MKENIDRYLNSIHKGMSLVCIERTVKKLRSFNIFTAVYNRSKSILEVSFKFMLSEMVQTKSNLVSTRILTLFPSFL